MTCKSALPFIEPYMDGELDAAQKADIERHLSECAECAAAHQRLNGLRADLRTFAPRYDAPEHLLLDPALMLPFSLPTSTDMLVSYGAGFGGLNRERERKYITTVPPDFLAKLDLNGGRAQPTFDPSDWENEDV